MPICLYSRQGRKADKDAGSAYTVDKDARQGSKEARDDASKADDAVSIEGSKAARRTLSVSIEETRFKKALCQGFRYYCVTPAVRGEESP